MELAQYLKEKKLTMAQFGAQIDRAQSIISRLINKKHRPDPTTAVNIVIATRGKVTLDDQYGTPTKYRADRQK